MNDFDLQKLQAQWQTEENQIKDIDMDTILKNAGNFQKAIKRRNSIEWIASLLLAPLFIAKMVSAATLWSQLMYAELTLALILISAILYYRGRLQLENDASLSTEGFIEHQRTQIQKQIQLLSKARYWYVAPLFLGMLGLGLDRLMTRWNSAHIPWPNVLFVLTLPLMAWGIIWLNEVYAVRDLKARLKTLS